MKRCVEKIYSLYTFDETHEISINNSLRTECCMWNVPSNIRILTIDDEGAVERPETLLDNEHCIYGGIYIYSKVNDSGWQEVYSECRKGINKCFEFIPRENTDTVITAVVFYPYSAITDQDFIKIDLDYLRPYIWSKALMKYMTRIDNCNPEKVCKASINFPVEHSLNNNLKNIAFHTQYIGHSDVSMRLEFSHQLAPAYTVYFTSSLCNTPPHYCTCIKLQVQYSNPVSYFVPEANRAEHFFIPNTGGYEADISFASSLYINMSACEARSYKIWWMLTFVKWTFFPYKSFSIITPNISFALQLNEETFWHRLQFGELLTPIQPPVWWFLLHIMEGQHRDIVAKVCIHCLLCHDIKLNVEILQQGKDESIIYNITNYTLIDDAIYTHRPFRTICVTGITCTTCNIILTYQGSQTDECRCELSKLGVSVRTFVRQRNSASATSIRGNTISKVSKR